MGETQEERILQFLEENDAPVVGLREGGILRCENGSVRLNGAGTARLFRRCQAPVEAEHGASLDEFLRGSAA
jgi:dipeptidase E